MLNSVEEDSKPLYTVVLCHSFMRCQDVSETLNELSTFCADMVEVLCLDSVDFTEIQLKLSKSMQNGNGVKSRVLVMTPSLALKL